MANDIDKQKRILVYKKYKGRCAYCGVKLQPDNFQVDHIDPQRKGTAYFHRSGRNDMKNLNPSCRTCNASKSDKTLEQFRDSLNDKIEFIKRELPITNVLIRLGVLRIKKMPIIFWFEKK